MKLSIIVPIYNAERYLRECIDSIISQSYEDWELICVNDGSTDGTKYLLEEYSTNTKLTKQTKQSASTSSLKSFVGSVPSVFNKEKIRVIHKENEGVAVARNIGIKHATGNYILFCDADDVMLPGTLQAIADSLEQNPVDYLRYEFKTIDAQGRDLYPNYNVRLRRRYTGMIVDAATCISNIVCNDFFLWSGAFRRDIIADNNLTFLDGCTYNEDTLFMLQYFCHSRTHTYLDVICYGYRKFDGAVTARFTEKNFHDIYTVFQKVIQLLPEDQRLRNAMKGVAERLGRRLIEATCQFDNKVVATEVIKLCTNSPVTIDWRLYRCFGGRVWNVLDVVRKLKRRF